MNTLQTLFIHILFVFMCHSHLYFSFNTLLMPQWIKIQSLLEINNTQNIQRILECFTVRVLQTFSDSTWTHVLTAASQMTQRGLRPRSNHIHKCFLVSWISTLALSHLSWTQRQGKKLSESIRMHSRFDLFRMLRCSITPHQQRAQQQTLGATFPFNTASDYRLKGMYKQGGNSFFKVYLPFFFNRIIRRN